jgi:hypothetical protein
MALSAYSTTLKRARSCIAGTLRSNCPTGCSPKSADMYLIELLR